MSRTEFDAQDWAGFVALSGTEDEALAAAVEVLERATPAQLREIDRHALAQGRAAVA